jgi:hypothetical protein
LVTETMVLVTQSSRLATSISRTKGTADIQCRRARSRLLCGGPETGAPVHRDFADGIGIASGMDRACGAWQRLDSAQQGHELVGLGRGDVRDELVLEPAL